MSSSISDKDKTREQLIAELQELRFRLAHKDGYAEGSASGTEDDKGASSGSFIEASVRAREAGDISLLPETAEVFLKLLENFPNGSINIFDKDLRYLLAAGRGLGQVDMFAHELVGKTLKELYSPEEVAIVTPYYLRAFEGHDVTFDFSFHGRVYNINAAPLTNKQGETHAIIAVAQDVTRHRRAEAALHELEYRAIREYEQLLVRLTHLSETFGTARDLDTIFRALRDFSVASLPCIGIFISLYDAARDVRTARYAWGDGDEVDVSQLPPMPITAEGPNSRAVRTGRIIITDDYSKIRHGVPTVPIGTNDGRLPLSSLVAPMSVMGRIVGTVEVQSYERAAYKEEHVAAIRMAANLAAVAIENVRLFEHESRARRAAEESNRIKDEFLATLSHELRTPLTAILGWSRLLHDRELDEKTSLHALDIIERNARAQKQIIEDILDVSRIITGKTRLDVRPVELEPVVEAAIESVRPAAAAKEIELNLLKAESIGLVSGDPERLQQVVWNLLSNAVKFTPHNGRIEICLGVADGNAQVVISDTGEGIGHEFLPFVFDRFRQADGSTTRVHGGIGLGLSIVRHLVELHGGTVRAESAGPGLGSTFTVSLPLVTHTTENDEEAARSSALASPAEEREHAPTLEGLRVLVVDDEPDALEYLRVVLERSRAEVTAVQSATEALAALEQGVVPDVIVSDIGMPGMDGYGFMRSLRQLPPSRGGSLPAIALTAYARGEDRARALREGYQMHIPKPFDPHELVMVVATLSGKARMKDEGGRMKE